MPFGPNVVFTMSAMAIAPTKDDIRAFSPYAFIVWLAHSPQTHTQVPIDIRHHIVPFPLGILDLKQPTGNHSTRETRTKRKLRSPSSHTVSIHTHTHTLHLHVNEARKSQHLLHLGCALLSFYRFC